jgi:hypothetical protein
MTVFRQLSKFTPVTSAIDLPLENADAKLFTDGSSCMDQRPWEVQPVMVAQKEKTLETCPSTRYLHQKGGAYGSDKGPPSR